LNIITTSFPRRNCHDSMSDPPPSRLQSTAGAGSHAKFKLAPWEPAIVILKRSV